LFISCGNPIIQRIVGAKTIRFETNGGSKVEDQTVFKGRPVRRPPDPSKSGYNFIAWYADNDTFLQAWNFNAIPEEEMTLYARWEVDTVISSVAVTVMPPSTGAEPNPTATANYTANFTPGPVSWDPPHDLFKGNTVYTASVTLTAKQDYSFASSVNAAINSLPAGVSHNDDGTITISLVFDPTEASAVSTITVKTQPTLDYEYGDLLNLAGLEVILAYEDGSTADVAFNDFGSNILTTPLNNAVLTLADNGTSVAITRGGATGYTNPLIVTKKQLTVTGAAHSKEYDTTTSAIGVDVTLGGIVGSDTVGAAVTAEYISANAGTTTINISAITLTGAAAGNYTVPQTGTFTVDGITKAPGAAVTAPVITGNAEALSVSVATAASLAAATGQSIQYAIYDGSVLSAYGNSTTFTGLAAGKTYTVYARSAEDTNYLAGTPSASNSVAFNSASAGISISVEQIEDQSTLPADNIIISRTGSNKTFVVTVSNPGDYTSITWEIDGVGYYYGTTITDSGPSYTLDATRVEYNSLGGHTLRLTVTKGGVQYMVNINFTIVDL